MQRHITLNNFTLAINIVQKPAAQNYYRHLHTEYEFLLFLDGDAEFIIENNIFRLEPYDIVVIRPGEYHLLNLLSDRRYARYVLNFHADRLPAALVGKLQKLEPHIKPGESSTTPAMLFEKMINNAARYDNETCELLADSFLTELIIHLEDSSTHKPRTSTNVNPLVNDIIKYINKNIEKPMSLKQISDALYLSQSQISHRFAETMDIPIMKYVKVKRIYHAQSLLLAGTKPSDVWHRCGYNDYTTFYRAFKDVTGKMPSSVKP